MPETGGRSQRGKIAVRSPDQDAILLTRDAGVATITLNRPELKNALTPEHFALLSERFEEVAANPEDRVLVLTGSGGAFCSGADLKGGGDAAKRIGQGPIARAQFTREAIEPALKLHRLPKPTIAAVNGVAAGGGCNLALGCDIVFAAESARFAQVFVNRGLSVDYGGTWLLPRLIGMQKAKDLAFRGDVIGSQQALELGLALEVVPDAELMKRVDEYARNLVAKPPIALSLIKSGMNRLMSASFEEGLEFEADAQATCLGSNDFREAMVAWMKKRDGQYTGE
jgi:2-(1,2-epoxy-1,2-dihydrophenyl)acetyl-CoA isomerase